LIRDTKQIDIKNKRLSSLDTVIRMFSEKSGVGTLLFETKDIVRSKIVMMMKKSLIHGKKIQLNSDEKNKEI
jgi:phosphate starvation-inducible protein PhoH